MTCETIHELLSERLDDAIGSTAQVQVEEHLATCSACRDLAARLARVVEDLALLSDVRIPDGLGERMAARVPSPVAFNTFNAGRGGPTRPVHDLRRVAGWAAVMILMSLTLVGRGFTGRLADGVAPVLAEARQQVLQSDLRGESLLARLDSGAERGFKRLAAAALGSER